jgi:drug/metabolite transporter (DMT)-like permease
VSAWTLAVAAVCMAFSGFAALGLAMDRHHEDSYGRGSSPGARRPWLRVAGTFGLLLSLAACLRIQGPPQGWVLWLGVLTAGALGVVGLLSYAPRRAARMAAGAGVLAVLTALLALLLPQVT